MKKINKIRANISKDIKQQVGEIKASIYKELWNDERTKRAVFKFQFDEFVVVVEEGRISFDKGESFIPRSEEKEILNRFDSFIENLIDAIIEDMLIEEIEEECDCTKQDFKAIDDLDSIGTYKMAGAISVLQELDVVDEQIELARKIKGGEEKLFNLLEDKRKLLLQMRSHAEFMLNMAEKM